MNREIITPDPGGRLSMLTRAIEQINDAAGPEEVLRLLVELSVQLCGADAGAVGVRADGSIHFKRIFRDTGWHIAERCFVPGEGVAGQLLEQGKALTCPDCRDDSRVSWQLDQVPGLTTLLALPLRSGRQLLGCLELYSRRSAGVFAGPSMDLLEALVASAAGALAKNRRLQVCQDEQREMEICLDRFRRSQQFCDLGTWEWNLQTDEVYWSESIGPLFGYPAGVRDLTYERFLSIVHPGDRPAVIGAIDAAIEKDRSYQIEHRVIWPDGSTHWVLERGGVQRDNRGTPLRMLGVVQDITRRRQVEQALRESEARFRGLVESTSDWIWEVDQQGRYTYVSPQVGPVLGYTPDALIGKSPFDLMLPHERDRLHDEFFALVRDRQPIRRLVNTNRHISGRNVVLETSGVPFYDHQGRLAGYRGIDRDITDRIAAERALEKQTLHNRLILENSLDGLVILELDGAIREVNDAYCRMVGYGQQELLKMNAVELNVFDQPETVLARLEKIRARGHDRFEIRHQTRGGDVIDLDVSAAFARVGDDQFIFSFVRDITGRRQREQQRLQEVREQRDLLVREVHHRIKNHLQGIINLLRNHIRDEPHLTDALESAIGQVESIALVHGLQSRLTQGGIELAALLKSICDALGHLAAVGIALDIQSPETAIHIRPDDAVPLALIINELLQNGIKHGDSAGQSSNGIEVTLGLEQEQVILRISNLASDGAVENIDLGQGIGLGTGLTLTRDLLPHLGADLSLAMNQGRAVARLVLEAPVVRLQRR